MTDKNEEFSPSEAKRLVFGSDKGGRQGLHLGMWLPGHARQVGFGQEIK